MRCALDSVSRGKELSPSRNRRSHNADRTGLRCQSVPLPGGYGPNIALMTLNVYGDWVPETGETRYPSRQRELSCLRRHRWSANQNVYQLRRCLLRCKILDTLRRSIYPEGLLKGEWLIEAEQLVGFDTHALVASLVVSKKPFLNCRRLPF